VPRFGLVSVLAAAIGAAPLVPPEHVHAEKDHDHRHRVIVHRHADSHGTPHHDEHHDGVPPDGVLDEHGSPVLTLTVLFAPPTAPLSVGMVATTVVAIVPQAPVTARRLHNSAAPLIHGPPLAPASLRAPPSLPAL
jgi:hypothetical protein